MIRSPRKSSNAPANHMNRLIWKNAVASGPMSCARNAMMPGTRTSHGPIMRANARVCASDSTALPDGRTTIAISRTVAPNIPDLPHDARTCTGSGNDFTRLPPKAAGYAQFRYAYREALMLAGLMLSGEAAQAGKPRQSPSQPHRVEQNSLRSPHGFDGAPRLRRKFVRNLARMTSAFSTVLPSN